MGISYDAIVAVGEVFDSEEEIIGFVNVNRIGALQPQDIMELQDSVYDYFEDRKHQQYPSMDSLNLYTGKGGYYVGYDITDKDPQKMIENIQKYTKLWKQLFRTEPRIITEVRVG